jgi:hypothetical protein
MPRRLSDYRSFWAVWLGCAGNPEGRTLFSIQKEWGITTNYLYHREPGLNMPIYKAMAKDGYIKKEKKKIMPKFAWIPDYVISMHKPTKAKEWSMNIVMLENWALVQEFLEKHKDVLFSQENLTILYSGINAVSSMGPYIFDDIFSLIIISNILPFCAKYRANLVSRIMYTLLSLSSGRNLMGYFNAINTKLKSNDFPRIIASEEALMDILYPLE